MRAFDDICVAPGFDEENAPHEYKRAAVQTTLFVGLVLAAAAVSLGTVPGLDASSVRYVLRLAGLRP